MTGNTFGQIFTLTSFGESHGPAIGGVIDGCPPGMELKESDIQLDLDRRKPGTSKFVTQRKEDDSVEILSGVFEGLTTGAPIGFIIRNKDQRSQDYSKIKEVFRPGHADITYLNKYGIRDYRGGGRSSARETAVRVAAGAVAKKWLKENRGIEVMGYLKQLGEIDIPFENWEVVNENPFFAPSKSIIEDLENYLDDVRADKNSVGANIFVCAKNMPIGLGEPVFSRLDADIASAMMSINATKGVEIGAGFRSVKQKGTQHSDEMSSKGFKSNNSGGVLGGISTGQDIEVNVAFKPTSSIPQDRNSIDTKGREVDMKTTGRHDPCVAIRAVPIVEAMLSLVLIDHVLRDRAQNADVVRNNPFSV
ncbi:MAG: chorismate synthase [Nitrosomonadales bacterium]|jgi:chorismate synthase|nr:chorismate synthase [Nitrosomonadales bacterium]MBT4182990.1 chorismate synthase [Nitrosomonadales bacterium]MBT4759659.1 chorismate synthase [Nitrosomonadales bacterium]MBT5149730.1 chorismate synthase [Nitrosomonadales bacterium]MBT5573096.1 chorismate synthase [Nitrosomonadales bacterium]